MKIRLIALSAVAGAALFFASPALPHHSNVAFEVTKVITIKGAVKGFRWANPHTWVYVTVDDPKGGKVEWACEGRFEDEPDCPRYQGGWDDSCERATC